MTIRLIATTIMGFESVLAQEIKQLGLTNIQVMDHKVEFDGTLADICRANIHLRTAGRVYIKMGTFTATTFDELFDQTAHINWHEWLSPTATFPIAQITSRKSSLFSKSTCQAIVKKAMVSQLKKHYGACPETGAEYPIRVQIEKDVVTLSIDTSGWGLNKRGYRAQMNQAPLRETLAAGLILLSRWRPDQDVLLDPMCGTGTLLIEAGLMAKNIAPGLNRSFGSEQWPLIPQALWRETRQNAKDAITPDAPMRIYGSDHDPKSLEISRKNSQMAGLTDIFTQRRDITEIASRFDRGKIITNPPYGERMQEQEEVELLYKEMGQRFRSHFPHWSYYILTPHDDFETLFGAESTKHRKLYNGGIKCWYYQYWAKPNTRPLS